MNRPEDASTREKQVHLNDLIIYHFHLISNLWSLESGRIYRDRFGLKVPEVWTIHLVADAPGITISEISSRSQMDKAAVSRAVTALWEHGMLIKADDPQDQRLIRLTLSEKGRALHEALLPIREARQQRLEDVLSVEERETLFEIFRKFETALTHSSREDWARDIAQGDNLALQRPKI